MSVGAIPEPSSPQTLLWIADPNLKGSLGHHNEYDSAVVRAAQAQGLRPVLLAGRGVAPEIVVANGAEPCFSENIWGPPERRGPWGTLAANLRFLGELRRSMRRSGRSARGTLFVHTFTKRQILGVALLALLAPGLPMVLLLRYQPDFYRGWLSRVSLRLLERFASGHVRLASDSERLAHELEALTTLPVEVLPIPHVPPALDTPPGAEPADTHFVSLGNARDEKGFLEILAAVRLLNETGQSGGCRFTLQCNDALPDVAAAIEHFRAAAIPCCRLLDRSLTTAEYYGLLAEADIVLLPYWRSIYEARTSGVFMEALSAGKPVIATADTWMSDQLRDYGAGLLCPERDAAALARLIREAAARKSELLTRAAERRDGWLATHNAAALVAAVATPQQRAAADPPRRIAVLYPWDDLGTSRSGAARRANLMVAALASSGREIRVLQAGCGGSERRGTLRVERLGPEGAASRLARLTLRTALLGFGAAGRRHAWMFWQHVALRFNPAQRRRLRRLVTWADAVLLEYPFWSPVVTRMARRAGRRVVLSAYDVLAEQVRDSTALRRLAWRFEEAALRKADYVVAVSTADLGLLSQHGISATLAPNPTDTRLFALEALPEPWRILKEFYGVTIPAPRILLFVGSRHEPNLVAVERLRGLARALAARPDTASIGVVVAGTCAAPVLDANFMALGAIEDVLLLALHRVALAAAIPLPFGTGSSLKTVEAMAAGLPVIGTTAAFRGLAVTDGENALLEEDLARWPDRIAALAADPVQRDRLSAAARRFATAYAPERCFAPYAGLLGLPPPPADPAEPREAFLAGLARQAQEAGRLGLAAHLLSALPDGHPARAVTASGEGADRLRLSQSGRELLWERFHSGAYAEVAAAAADMLRIAPSDAELNFLLAQSLHNGALDLPRALPAYDAALSGGHDRFWVLAGRARLHRDLGQRRAACRDYLCAAASRPLHPATPRLLAQVLLLGLRRRRQRHDPAAHPDRAAVAAAWIPFHEGAYPEAAAAAARLLADAPGSSELNFLLAQSLHNGALDLAAALPAYDAALAAGYDPFWVLAGRARLYRDLQQPGAAWRDSLRAVFCRPSHPASPRLLAQGLRLGLRALRRPAPHGHADPAAVAAAWTRFHLGAFADAAAAAGRLLAEAPRSGELHFLLAQSLHNDRLDLPRALAEYNAALAAGHDPFWVLAGRARLHRDLGQWVRARRDYCRAAARRPWHPATPGLLAQALRLSLQMRRPGPASHPDRAALAVAWARFHQGAYAEAAEAAAGLLREVPGSGELHFLLAQSLHNGSLNLASALPAYDAALAAGYEPYWTLAGRSRLHRELGHARAALTDAMAAFLRRPFRRLSLLVLLQGGSALAKTLGLGGAMRVLSWRGK